MNNQMLFEIERRHDITAVLLCCIPPANLLGVHKHYLDHPRKWLHTFTLGFLGIWVLFDLFKIGGWTRSYNMNLAAKYGLLNPSAVHQSQLAPEYSRMAA